MSCAERESVQVFDPANPGNPPTEVLLKGEQPRALAVSPDGTTVYAAFFESGNHTTVIPGNEFHAGGFCSVRGRVHAASRTWWPTLQDPMVEWCRYPMRAPASTHR